MANKVNYELKNLLIFVPYAKETLDRPRHRAYAKKLDTALTNVETLLDSAPRAFADLWLRPIMSIESGGMPQPQSPSIDGEMPQPQSSSIQNLIRAYRNQTDSFVAELTRLHDLCAYFIDPNFGHHSNYDHAKHMSARLAFVLMLGLSDVKITSTEAGAFRTITNLLYEAISGEPYADLKRACDNTLDQMDISCKGIWSRYGSPIKLT